MKVLCCLRKSKVTWFLTQSNQKHFFFKENYTRLRCIKTKQRAFKKLLEHFIFLWACRCCQTLEMQFQALHVNWNITACNNTCGRFSVWFLTPRTAKTCCCFLITSHSFLSTPFHYFCSLQLQSCRINWKRANRRGFTIGELSTEETPEWRNETGARCTSKGRRWSHWQMRFSQTCIGMFLPTVVNVWKKTIKQRGDGKRGRQDQAGWKRCWRRN